MLPVSEHPALSSIADLTTTNRTGSAKRTRNAPTVTVGVYKDWEHDGGHEPVHGHVM